MNDHYRHGAIAQELLNPAPVAESLANVLGMSALGLAESWRHQAAQRLEQIFEDHYKTHGAKEWVILALTQRRDADALNKRLVVVLEDLEERGQPGDDDSETDKREAMVTGPKLLDLFCGAGGAAMGYHRAGFEVVGVDLHPQPNYPFEFHQGDARDFIAAHWREFDAIHASPPCQASTALTKGTNAGREYPQLIPETRRLLRASGLPTVLENVQGSDLRRDVTLCGEMFGLDVIRHRYFELGGWAAGAFAVHKPHRGRVRGWRHGAYHDGPYVAVYGEGGGKGSVAEWQAAMGIDWTNDRKEIAEAIPPAYTEWVGSQLIAHLESGVAA